MDLGIDMRSSTISTSSPPTASTTAYYHKPHIPTTQLNTFDPPSPYILYTHSPSSQHSLLSNLNQGPSVKGPKPHHGATTTSPNALHPPHHRPRPKHSHPPRHSPPHPRPNLPPRHPRHPRQHILESGVPHAQPAPGRRARRVRAAGVGSADAVWREDD